jgi:hypothetical protein
VVATPTSPADGAAGFGHTDDAVAGQDALDVALGATIGALNMQAVYVGTLTDATFTFSRVLGDWPGLRTGMQMPRGDSLCGRMLAGASPVVADLSRDSAYSDSPVHLALGVQSYVGVPLQRFSPDGPSTLCGIHPVPMQPSAEAVRLTYALADALSALLIPQTAGGVVLRRRADGWSVDAASERGVDPSLLTAMTLADLLAEDLSPGARPRRTVDEGDEVSKLRTVVSQLEHALAARVVVEQAIGVLAERLKSTPREAFERLRRGARTRGRRVHDLAKDVVTSVNSPVPTLPPEFGRSRTDLSLPARSGPRPTPRPTPPPRPVSS